LQTHDAVQQRRLKAKAYIERLKLSCRASKVRSKKVVGLLSLTLIVPQPRHRRAQLPNPWWLTVSKLCL
jgi:hypothetical protein